jgi:alkylation response protein AidB-like acyl-CoA dehydrogenase
MGEGTTATPQTAPQVTLTARQIRENVAALGPLIREQADAVNEQGCLTDAVKQALAEAGAFRIGFPESWGGPEMRLLDQLEMIEDLATHDASVAWNVMILADSGFYALGSEPEVARELFPSIDLATAGSARPAGRAEVLAEGGYRLSGHWSFGSGVRNADRVLGGFHKYIDGEVVLNEQGEPELFQGWMPAEKIKLYDAWHVTGLAGTGSTQYSIEDAVVPETWVKPFGWRDGETDLPPLSRYGIALVLNGNGVALGVARRGLEEFHALLDQPTRMDTRRSLQDQDPDIPIALAKATALYEAARAAGVAAAQDADDTLFAGLPLTREQHARMLHVGWVIGKLARQSLETVMEAIGARTVLADHPFDRLYRDMSTLARHSIHRDKTLVMAGRTMLDMPVGSHLIG